MRFRTILELYNLRRKLRLKPSELREMQNKKLRAIVAHAYKNVPFYHRKLKNANIRPDNIKVIEDLAKIPLSSKNEIQSTPLNEMIAIDVDVSKCKKNTTSGSTGIPLILLVDKKLKILLKHFGFEHS